MKEIFFIRHGRQCSKRCNVDVSLDASGRRQAELAAKRLAGYGIEALYSSGLKRALETAEIIGRRLGLDAVTVEAFREIDFGTMTGKTDDELIRDYTDFRKERALQTSDLPYPGGESGRDVVKRALPELERICGEIQNRAAIVAHGGVIRSLCAHLLETDLKNKLKFAIDLENTSITQINYDEEKGLFYLERFNDFAHLENHPELLRQSWKASWIRKG